MNKQALIITAYQNGEMLEENLRLFSKYFMCYVHIDSKSELNNSEYISKLNTIENVYAISKYKINWGSYLHMMAIVDLLREAYNKPQISRFHIISGEDFPIKTFEEFNDFFITNNFDKNFIELTDIRNMPIMKLRYEKYHFLHIFNRKSKNKAIVLIDKIIRQVQYHLPLKRKINFDYKGLIWGSITREAVNNIFEYLSPKKIRSLKYCEIAEEFLLQNSLMESKLRDTVVTNNLRYANWEKSKTGPRVLSMKDLNSINKSQAFFARKVQKTSLDDSINDLYIYLQRKWLE